MPPLILIIITLTKIKGKRKEFYMEKKMGRPITKERNKDLHVRISEAEKNLIQECADKLGITKIDAIMEGIRLLMEKE